MSFSIKDRHETYKKALKIVKREAALKHGPRFGLCYAIDKSKPFLTPSPYQDPKAWPEFWAQRPKKRIAVDSYWWSRGDRGMAARIRALERCIELTAPKKK